MTVKASVDEISYARERQFAVSSGGKAGSVIHRPRELGAGAAHFLLDPPP